MEKKCPKCDSDCWRDEHPDGIIAGNWSCSVCDWFEAKTLDKKEIDVEELPF
jgi:hypothetical protein